MRDKGVCALGAPSFVLGFPYGGISQLLFLPPTLNLLYHVNYISNLVIIRWHGKEATCALDKESWRCVETESIIQGNYCALCAVL